ncbi:MAG: xanthine dehydrogenase family protein subunit M [Bryobacteraceae bacterium]
MIPQNFEYSSPDSLQEALSLLADGSAKALGGGMSLIPMMKLRLAAPEHLVDLRRIPGLSGIAEDGAAIRIGAMTTHYQVESSALLRFQCPLLAETASHIGDVQVRNVGTLGGSVAHADPAADYPAALIALEAQVQLIGTGGTRTLGIEAFLVDTMTTAIEPGELVQSVIVPVEERGTGVNYQKMLQPASGFAIVGIAARIRESGGRITFARIGVTGLAGKAYRARGVEDALLAGSDVRSAAGLVAEGIDANSDLFASAEYRCHLARVYTARAIEQAIAGVS